MPFVAALSAHPLAAHATGEVVGRVLESLPEPPDVAVLFVSGAHGRQFAQIADTVRATLGPRALIGATAFGLLAGERSVIEQPAVALWAGSATGAQAVRLQATTVAGEAEVEIVGADLDDGASTLIVLAGPSFPLDAALAVLRRRHPWIAVVGGVVAAGVRPGDNQLRCDEHASTSGAVGLVLGHAATDAIVSRGFRPIGVPLVVTGAEGVVVRELAGRPILDRLDEVLLELDDETAAGVGRSLHLGQVVDEHRVSFGPGDFVEREVTAVDRLGRSLTVSPAIPVGATVQFLGQDAAGADRELREHLSDRRAAGALAFVTTERSELFTDPDHDVELVSTVVDGQATIGAICTAVVTSWPQPLIDDGPTAIALLVDSRDALV